MIPVDVTCPTCHVPAGQPCTAPTNTCRRVVHWTHFSRDDLAHMLNGLPQ